MNTSGLILYPAETWVIVASLRLQTEPEFYAVQKVIEEIIDVEEFRKHISQLQRVLVA